ncbi:trehalose 6-phosphatase [Klenkia marina]|uniref:Trehalose 6-phosphate phosphatase n=1 Tax=Klenkia marina TaxID=1960309 RepID=A0A1G4XPB3_9ACTN|nr:trehalose-phosphatase [Klenkia marina]SCX42967.1 trehalose 6-phosphatase [Klenkia marina]
MTTDLTADLTALAGRRPLLVASDYDGVLARLRDVPGEAVPEEWAPALLRRLAAADGVVVALVSGRGVDDLRTTSGFGEPFRFVGSHGAETDDGLDPAVAAERDLLVDALGPLVDAVEGARLEVKPAAVAVHVRTVADRAAATALLERAAAAAGPHHTAKPGKDVLELAVTDADKGTAVLRLAAQLGADGVLYLGDDLTDEDAFTALAPRTGSASVKVGAGDTAASLRVADLDGVRDLLEELARALGV